MKFVHSISIVTFSALLVVGTSNCFAQQGETPAVAQPAVHVESTRPVLSPDGKQVLIVDHLMPIDETGQKDEFSGLLKVRLSSAERGTTMVRSRDIEAPRVRTVRAPQWLDNRWAVVEYSISRASRGVAYLDGASGRVVQLEIVTVTGGGASERTEGNRTLPGGLAHFEVQDSMPDGTVSRVSSLTHGQASVFPIVIGSVTKAGEAATVRPDGTSALDDVLTGMAAWETWKAKLEIPGAAVDQASESVSPDGKLMAALICTERGPRLVVMPISSKSPEDVFGGLGVVTLSPSIRLSCQDDGNTGGNEAGGEESFGESRYGTLWQGPDQVIIFRENFNSESDQPVRTNLLSAKLEQGEIRLSKLSK
jgi:hypothetical protein